jgi:hypothetical protein
MTFDAVGAALWLHYLSVASLSLGAIWPCSSPPTCSGIRKRMWIMNMVWPVTALLGAVLILWQYFTYGRASEPAHGHAAVDEAREHAKPKADAVSGHGCQWLSSL